MIIRIVKLSFHPGHSGEFLELFEKYKTSIASAPGCKELKLLKDSSTEGVFFTYSLWENEDALDDYRTSDLFNEVWPKTKLLFNAAPQAWTLEDTGVI
jgi:autoinducer 2-degrading protein